MNVVIKWLDAHPKLKPWLWFIALWCTGLAIAFVLTLPFKILINLMSGHHF